mgnify:CR=1 FL=1
MLKFSAALPANIAAESIRMRRRKLQAQAMQILPPLLGVLLFLLAWQMLAGFRSDLPGPGVTWDAALTLFADPFYENGPNDMGIGWNVLHSLARVGLGFGMAAVVGIPLGFIVGRSAFISGMLSPIMGLLRPVSPLAWLPIGLLVFQKAEPASIWVIFISSIWPMILNTAAGVRQVPQDYLNVARVLNLSEWKVLTTILFPAVLPYLLTGVRLAIGVAWLVIVAAEMLTGGVGIGFFIWDAWNSSRLSDIIVALIYIGIVGFVLDRIVAFVANIATRGAQAS